MRNTLALKTLPSMASVVRHIRHDWLYFCAVNRRLFKKENFLKYFAFSYGLYFVGIFGIILADFYYKDDLRRAQSGALKFVGAAASRYLAEYGLYLLGGWDYETKMVVDASPLYQLVAIAILTFGSICLVKLVAGRLSYWGIMAALPLGLSPYFLQNLSYKFDAPVMSLSVAATIVPFLYLRRLPLFAAVSFASLLVMLTTYQASNGIYPTLVFFVVVCALCQAGNFSGVNGMHGRRILNFTACAALTYFAALVFFNFVLREKGMTYSSYKTGALMNDSLVSIAGSIKNNVVLYLKYLDTDLQGTLFAKLCVLVALLFVLSFVLLSKGIKTVSLPVAIMFVGVGLFTSYGLYFALKEPFFEPRAFCGFGCFLAVLTIFVSRRFFWNRIAVFVLSYNLLVIASVYANAMSEQHKYYVFRRDMMIADLLKVVPQDVKTKIDLRFLTRWERLSPVFKVNRKYFPLIARNNFEDMKSNFWVWREYNLVMQGHNFAAPANAGKCAGKIISVHENRLNLIRKFPNDCYEIYFK